MYNYDYLNILNDLITRVHYGCKKELLNLVSLKGIGRIRARALYMAGFTDLRKIALARQDRIASIPKIGVNMAKKIKEQLTKS